MTSTENLTVNTMSVGPMELQEFLFSETLKKFAAKAEREKNNAADYTELTKQTRETLRLHRFSVMNWLMQNGVKIPTSLMSDGLHTEVGKQYPDRHRQSISP